MEDMLQQNLIEEDRIEQVLSTVTEWSDTLFDQAPVMMHSINREGELVRVNRRWLTTLGYHQDEVLGQKTLDFLTDESRFVAVRDTLPLFWQAGSARSVGYQFLRKNGRVLNVLLDADTILGAQGEFYTSAALRARGSRTQWQQASTALRHLRDINQLHSQLASLLSANSSEIGNGDPGALEPLKHGVRLERATRTLPELVEVADQVLESVSPKFRLQEGLTEEAPDVLIEASRDVAANLRTLVRVHED